MQITVAYFDASTCQHLSQHFLSNAKFIIWHTAYFAASGIIHANFADTKVANVFHFCSALFLLFIFSVRLNELGSSDDFVFENYFESSLVVKTFLTLIFRMTYEHTNSVPVLDAQLLIVRKI